MLAPLAKKNPQFLDPQETFEHYENRSRPTSSLSFEPIGSHGRLACEYRAAPPPSASHGRLACEYRAEPAQPASHGRLACEYRAAPPQPGSNGVMACEYRANPVSDGRYRIEDVPMPAQGAPKIITYLPESTKRKIPLSAILAVAIGVPVVLVLCLFGAVWLQELGIL